MSTGPLDRLFELVNDPHRYTGVMQIMNEQTGELSLLEATPAQKEVLDALAIHKRVVVNKYRQAYITTIGVLWMLGKCMWSRGYQGYLLTDSRETTDEGFSRLSDAYQELPKAIKPKSKLASTKHLKFSHGGGIRALTAGSKNPGIGKSTDVAVLSEIGMWHNPTGTMQKFTGSYRKRPHARILIESTPGKAGEYFENFWRAAWEGENDWYPIFLKWWIDPTCTIPPPPGWAPSASELDYLDAHEGMTLAHLYFRHQLLAGEFNGDTRLFDNQYPPSPMGGFTSGASPLLPADALNWIDTDSLDAIDKSGRWQEHEAYVRGRAYILTADPAGFGESGDPSAAIVWDTLYGKEVASWSGREDPELFAGRIQEMSHAYHCVLVAIESNAAACIQAARNLSLPLYETSKSHPGFYMTHTSKLQAMTELTAMLRQQSMNISSKATYSQISGMDKLSTQNRKGGHHYDRAICALIGAYLMHNTHYEPAEKPDAPARRGYTWDEL